MLHHLVLDQLHSWPRSELIHVGFGGHRIVDNVGNPYPLLGPESASYPHPSYSVLPSSMPAVHSSAPEPLPATWQGTYYQRLLGFLCPTQKPISHLHWPPLSWLLQCAEQQVWDGHLSSSRWDSTAGWDRIGTEEVPGTAPERALECCPPLLINTFLPS